jgi:hypothetical protein
VNTLPEIIAQEGGNKNRPGVSRGGELLVKLVV